MRVRLPGLRALQLPREDLPVERLPLGVLHLYERRLPEHELHLLGRELGRLELPVRRVRVRVFPVLRLPVHFVLVAVRVPEHVPLLRVL